MQRPVEQRQCPAVCIQNHRLEVGKFGLTLICRFIITVKSRMKYITKIGQNTGTSKNGINVQKMLIAIARVAQCLSKYNEIQVKPLRERSRLMTAE